MPDLGQEPLLRRRGHHGRLVAGVEQALQDDPSSPRRSCPAPGRSTPGRRGRCTRPPGTGPPTRSPGQQLRREGVRRRRSAGRTPRSAAGRAPRRGPPGGRSGRSTACAPVPRGWPARRRADRAWAQTASPPAPRPGSPGSPPSRCRAALGWLVVAARGREPADRARSPRGGRHAHRAGGTERRGRAIRVGPDPPGPASGREAAHVAVAIRFDDPVAARTLTLGATPGRGAARWPLANRPGSAGLGDDPLDTPTGGEAAHVAVAVRFDDPVAARPGARGHDAPRTADESPAGSRARRRSASSRSHGAEYRTSRAAA